MHPAGISRRAFLAASGGVIAAATITWPDLALAHDEPKLGKNLSALVLASDLYASPAPQRFVFGLGSERGYVSGPPVQVGFAPPGATGKQTLPLTRAHLYKAGLPKGRGVYVVDPVLDTAGVWGAVALVNGRQVRFAIQVNEAPVAPLVGAAAPTAASPTLTDPLGVHPICTRRPVCPLHTTSLADVIGKGSPVAVLFATPARCQSKYCGPVLDTLLSIRARYGGVAFVHTEIYRNNKTIRLTPTMEAWGLESEPWLFTIDGSGTITGRIDGAFGRDEMIQLLDTLTPDAAP